jgi:hypothetical protein
MEIVDLEQKAGLYSEEYELNYELEMLGKALFISNFYCFREGVFPMNANPIFPDAGSSSTDQ